MKLFLIVVSVAITVVRADGQGGYSLGSFQPAGGAFNFGSGGYSTGFNGASNGNSFSAGGYSSGPSTDGQAGAAGAPGPADGGNNVFKYISIHAAPEDPEDHATKTVRVPGGSNKHVNIIFVKAPSNGADQQTEVILPEQDEHKNLVYVLVQKTDVAANLQIRQPNPTKPPKPEVYFIRYKNQPSQGAGPNGQGPVPVDFSKNITPTGGNGSPSPAYGAP